MVQYPRIFVFPKTCVHRRKCSTCSYDTYVDHRAADDEVVAHGCLRVLHPPLFEPSQGSQPSILSRTEQEPQRSNAPGPCARMEGKRPDKWPIRDVPYQPSAACVLVNKSMLVCTLKPSITDVDDLRPIAARGIPNATTLSSRLLPPRVGPHTDLAYSCGGGLCGCVV